ncbi:DEAD/DEAH box helicase [bacterium]|nr:DEAD/DEAH box helicase [bacterium]
MKVNNEGEVTVNPSNRSLSNVTLEELPRALQEAAARVGWSSLMPVQARAVPYLLAKRNMIIQARTGSGKTGAFILPMLELLDASRPHCQSLILVPTRELAKQVWRETEILLGNQGLRTAAVYGGVGYKAQIQALTKGTHIVVGTPGRILDHLLKKNLDSKHLTMLIFDEADRMLSMGFYPDMIKLKGHLPKHLHTCMFSATFPPQVRTIAEEFIHAPEFLSLSEDHVHVTDTTHVFYTVPGMDKDRSLIRIIEIENPSSAIIFCNTKAEVHYVTTVLQRFGYDADELTSDLSQKHRERVLALVRQGTLRFLVATDVAARGLDIPSLSHVFQYQIPEDFEVYIHRAGRTGRAGATGVAIAMVNQKEKFMLNRIVKRYNIDMQEWPLPTDADVQTVVTERLTALLEARLRDRDKLKTERSRRFKALGRALAESEDESAIIAMLLDDYYQQMLHAPVSQPANNKSDSPKSKDSGDKNRTRKRRKY